MMAARYRLAASVKAIPVADDLLGGFIEPSPDPG